MEKRKKEAGTSCIRAAMSSSMVAAATWTSLRYLTTRMQMSATLTVPAIIEKGSAMSEDDGKVVWAFQGSNSLPE